MFSKINRWELTENFGDKIQNFSDKISGKNILETAKVVAVFSLSVFCIIFSAVSAFVLPFALFL